MSSRLALWALVLASCGGDAAFVPAPHTALPQVAKHQGVVLTSPEVVTITFPGYAHRATVEAFGDFLGGSAWLKTVASEYGVGAATHKAKVVWPTAAPANFTDQDLRKLLAQGITDGTLPKPPATGNNVVYVVYVPSSSILDATAFGAGVMCFRGSLHSAGGPYLAGYHDSITPGGAGDALVPFVAVGDCSNDEGEITGVASRELVGAFTNPYEVLGTGYLLDLPPTDPWVLNLNSGEVGYLCAQEPRVQEGGYALNRSWSNAAAAAGRAPCVPADGPYFNVTADPATVVSAAAGAQLSFTLTGWSTAAVPDWKLRPAKPEGSDFALAELGIAFSSQVINNGQSVTVSFTVPKTARQAQIGGVDILSGDAARSWPVAFAVK